MWCTDHEQEFVASPQTPSCDAKHLRRACTLDAPLHDLPNLALDCTLDHPTHWTHMSTSYIPNTLTLGLKGVPKAHGARTRRR